MVNGPESYDKVHDSLKKALEDINNFIAKRSTNFDGKILLYFFVGGDHKILLTVMGLSGTTSDYACLWCKIHKLERFDMSKPKDHYNGPPIASTLLENARNPATVTKQVFLCEKTSHQQSIRSSYT